MTREAELELVIERLREALEWALVNINCEPYEWTCEEDSDAHKAAIGTLSTPPSTTALQELIEKIERRTIERCALAANKAWFEDPCYIHTITDAIRALPTGNLKLEDLK